MRKIDERSANKELPWFLISYSVATKEKIKKSRQLL